MSGAAIAAWVAGGFSLVATAVAGALARKPRRSMALDEMQAALETQGTTLDRFERLLGRAYERIDTLEAEVVACEAGRAADRRATSAEIAELRATIRRLTDRR